MVRYQWGIFVTDWKNKIPREMEMVAASLKRFHGETRMVLGTRLKAIHVKLWERHWPNAFNFVFIFSSVLKNMVSGPQLYLAFLPQRSPTPQSRLRPSTSLQRHCPDDQSKALSIITKLPSKPAFHLVEFLIIASLYFNF